MRDSVLQTITEYNMLVRGDRIVCAVSGGADSVAMLYALCIFAERFGIEVFACHLNHGLRGEESDRDEAFVRDLCEKMNVPLYAEKIEIKGETGIEERAREARYAFFDRAVRYFDADKIATAHNAEDNIETVIFRIVRGSGLDGICGIPPVRGNIIRPLLFTSKEKILSFLRDAGQDWVEDSSNHDDKFTRNLIRHKVLPVLNEINSEAVSNATRTIRNLSADSEYLNSEAEKYLDDKPFMNVSVGRLPNALLSRVIRLKCENFVKNGKQVLDFSAICDIISLIRGEKTRGGITISKDLRIVREEDKIYFVKTGTKPLKSRVLKAGESRVFFGYKITCTAGEILVRARRDGDKIKLEGRRTRLIKKILCDAKIPQHMRDLIPIIEKDGEIVALCGFGYAEGGDKGCVKIEINSR
ncbi:MAG: tRNA lysidine(34) synthetase TilS [Clostridia bacterium]|nr:tRNA lysidine(34) synthetase TilS [Clostridia bacterium]